MAESSGKQGNVLIFPVPVELLRLIEKLGARAGTRFHEGRQPPVRH